MTKKRNTFITDIDLGLQKKIVRVMDYIMRHKGGSGCEVRDVMRDNGITMEEYRVIMNLLMPAIREYDEKVLARYDRNCYKKRCEEETMRSLRLENRMKKLESFMRGFLEENNTEEEKENEGDVHPLAGGDGEDAVQEGDMDYDGEDGGAEDPADAEAAAQGA